MAVTTDFKAEVMDVIDTLSGAEKAEIGNVIFTDGLSANKIAESHILMTGVNEGDPVIKINNDVDYKSFPFLDSNVCSSNECDLDIGFTTKKWRLALYNCRIGICMKSFDKNFLYFFRTQYPVLFGNYVSEGNVWDARYDSLLLDFLRDQFVKNLAGTAWRVGYFADSTLLSSDPNYELLRGGVDGFFSQAEEGDGLKITFNQTNPTGEEAYEALEKAYNHFMMEDWNDKDNVRWKLTKAFAGLLVRWLNGLSDKSQYNCECFNADGVTSARTFNLDNLYIFGIKADVERDLDGVIKQLELDRPYRALLTYKENMQIGTPSDEDIEEFGIWYERKDKLIYIEGEAYLGSMLVTDDYVYIGAETATP